jgi:F-type H+-transporting ATPase subunit delta
MSDSITVARPYAKAVFDLAKQKNILDEWDKLLSYLSIMMSDDNVVHFIKNRTISYNDKSRIIVDFLKSCNFFNDNIQSLSINFINVLAYYGRLLCVRDIYFLYKQYMNLELGRVEAIIRVACAMNNSQKDQMIDSLSKRFNKKILALFEIDKDLLGGFVVKTGDSVLDASVAGNLVSLRTKITM